MIEACLATKTHYLDITGGIDTFAMARGYDAKAKDAGIMLMPGTGFDVVPTDCLAKLLHNQLPDATHLQLAFDTKGDAFSVGTIYTMIESLGEGGLVRENGKLIRKPLGIKDKELILVRKIICNDYPWAMFIRRIIARAFPILKYLPA
ncbi:MAG: hypothetical protein IPJ74_26805 [Saprospiraceae bacterium]|nr:hypothetical protein [Saprospiraceae bacterium]